MNPQILLIEGEESQALAVQRILEPVGYEVVWAIALQDVIDFLSQSERPVVVSSLRFDPLDVFSLLRWLVVNRPQSRLIILSDGDVPPIRANGAIGFVSRSALSRLRALSSDALMGHLPAVSFADLIDVLCLLVLTKSTQRLHVIFDQEQGQLYIKQGQILHAQTDHSAGLAAFSEILGWTGGGVYELTWEEPAQPSLAPGEAEALLLGGQRSQPSSEGGLLSILEDAVERSIDAAPAPALLPPPTALSPIEQDFVAPHEAPTHTPEWPATAAPAQISEAIQNELDASNAPPTETPAEVVAQPSEPTQEPVQELSQESSQQEPPLAATETLPETPLENAMAAVMAYEQPAEASVQEPAQEPPQSLTQEPAQEPIQAPTPELLPEIAPQEPTPDPSAVIAQEPTSEEPTPHLTEQTSVMAEQAPEPEAQDPQPASPPLPQREEPSPDLSVGLAAALQAETSAAIRSFGAKEQQQTRQEILVQEVLLENSPLADLLHQGGASNRQGMQSSSKQEMKHHETVPEMEEVSLDGADPGVPAGSEEDEATSDGDVWAELSQEMEALSPVDAKPSPQQEQSPFEPPAMQAPEPPAANPAPFLPTPSYRTVEAQKPTRDEAPTEPDLVTQTPPMGLRISSKTTMQGQPYTISTPPSGTAIVDKNAIPEAVRTPPMGTRIVTAAKTPPMGNPIQHTTPVGVAPVPLPSAGRSTPSGAYPALGARQPSGTYRAVQASSADANMFSDYVTPPFGTRIPRGGNPDTPPAPTGSPLASAARAAFQEKPPAVGAGDAIAGLVPVLQDIAREVPEFVAAVAIEAESGLALGGVTSQTSLDADSGFAYYTEVLRLLQPALTLFDASLEELLVTSPKWYILLRPLRDEFFLGLITTRKGNLGICRIVLKRAATQLIERLPNKEGQ